MLAVNVCIPSRLCVSGHMCMCVWVCICYELQNFWTQGFVLFLQILLAKKTSNWQAGHLCALMTCFQAIPPHHSHALTLPNLALPRLLSYWVMNEWGGPCSVKGAPGTVGTFCVTLVCRTRRWIIRMLGTRNFLLARARKALCVCGLALSKQLLFVLSSNYLSKQKATVPGRTVHFFLGFAPFCTPSHSVLSDSVCFHSSGSGFQPAARQGLLRWDVGSSSWPSATLELQAHFTGWHLPTPKSQRFSQARKSGNIPSGMESLDGYTVTLRAKTVIFPRTPIFLKKV